jgi:hypothetical protein
MTGDEGMMNLHRPRRNNDGNQSAQKPERTLDLWPDIRGSIERSVIVQMKHVD